MIKWILPILVLFSINSSAEAGVFGNRDTLNFKSITITELPSYPNKENSFEEGAVEVLTYMRALKMWKLAHYNSIRHVRFGLMDMDFIKVDILCNSNFEVTQAKAEAMISDVAKLFDVQRKWFVSGKLENVQTEGEENCSMRFSPWQPHR